MSRAILAVKQLLNRCGVYDYKNDTPLEEIKRWNLGGKRRDERIVKFLEQVGITVELG